MADPRAPGRGRRGARARLGRGRPRDGGARAARAAGCARRRSRDAVRRTGARVVHAHNSARRSAGARSPRRARPARGSSCTCTTTGSCARSARASRTARTARAATAATRCPGVRLNCRGGSRAESAAYAAGLALWQRRLAGAADEIVVPSAFALGRLRELGAPLGDKARVLGSVQREFAERSAAADGEFVLAAGRLTPEKGFADVVEACERAGLPLVVAGDGPAARRAARRRAATRAFVGHVSAGRARGAARRARPWRSCRRATPRSSRSRRWRRWRPGCRRSPPRSGGLDRGRAGGGPVSARRRRRARRRGSPRCGATPPPASARSRPRARAARLTSSPAQLPSRLRRRNFRPPPGDEMRMIRRAAAIPAALPRPVLRHRADAAVKRQEGDLGPDRDRRRSRSSRPTRTSAPASTR